MTHQATAEPETVAATAENTADDVFAAAAEKTAEEDDVEAITVATSAVDELSVAPTEMLANEYQRLMNQYDQEVNNRKELEDKIEQIKRQEL